MDNLRGLLLVLTVFAHFLEVIPNGGALPAYRVIYSFHMPALLFLSGYFARPDPRRLWRDLLYPYLLFQTLYLWFDGAVISGGGAAFQYTTPYWIMWFLPALMAYQLLLPALDTQRPALQLAALAALTAAALLAGRDGSIGYHLSLSRILVFAPFFFAGYYGHKHIRDPWFQVLRRPWVKVLALAAAVGAAAAVLTLPITPAMLYGSYSYQAAGYGMKLRLAILAMAGVWIWALWSWTPDRPIPLFTAAGGHTLPVFLLHGFLMRLAGKYGLFSAFSLPGAVLLCALLALGLFLLLGSPWAARPLQFVMTGRWAEALARKWKKTDKTGPAA